MRLTIDIEPADLIAASELFGIRIATPEPAPPKHHLNQHQRQALRIAVTILEADNNTTTAHKLRNLFPEAFHPEGPSKDDTDAKHRPNGLLKHVHGSCPYIFPSDVCFHPNAINDPFNPGRTLPACPVCWPVDK